MNKGLEVSRLVIITLAVNDAAASCAAVTFQLPGIHYKVLLNVTADNLHIQSMKRLELSAEICLEPVRI